MDVAVSFELVTGVTAKVIPARWITLAVTVRVIFVYWLPCRVDCSKGCMSMYVIWVGPLPYGGWQVTVSPGMWGIPTILSIH